jgi:N-acetylmuramoyl-L-alanine amidase
MIHWEFVFMRKAALILLTGVILLAGGAGIWLATRPTEKISGAPPYGEALNEVPQADPDAWLKNWKRPEGPVKVALQAGHWKANEVPEELERLKNNTGSSGGGKWEWEVNLDIAQRTADILQARGIMTDILPVTIPPQYFADAFVAIHADGNDNRAVAGYKTAAPWRDWTGKASRLAENIDREYGNSTGLGKDPNISRNMRGYYAFSWWRYEHALHPMTTGVIIETGFLTNYGDRQVIVSNPQLAAEGIAKGIINYLQAEGLLPDQAGV